MTKRIKLQPWMKDSDVVHVLGISGGKDSFAMYLSAIELGIDFIPIYADTGNEHQESFVYLRKMQEKLNGPVIRIIRANFDAELAAKRKSVASKWPGDGVRPEKIAATLEVLQPSGNPFLDLCLMKGRFPSAMTRFCSKALKYDPIFEQILDPMLDEGKRVVNWVGLRAEESAYRAALNEFSWQDKKLLMWRPLLHWTLQDVLAIHTDFGLDINELYQKGYPRVGCQICVMTPKDVIKIVSDHNPEAIERIARWELLVAKSGKREIELASFFASKVTPEGRRTKKGVGIKDVVKWSQEGKRKFGKQPQPPTCLSALGLCET